MASDQWRTVFINVPIREASNSDTISTDEAALTFETLIGAHL